MKHLLLGSALFLTLTAGTCSITSNQALLADAQLAVNGLTALNNVLASVGAPAADTALTSVALGAVQVALTDVQQGLKTPQQFAQLFSDEMKQVGPTLLIDLHANATIVTGVTLLENMVPTIVDDLSPAPAMPKAGEINPRGALQAWITARR